MSSDSSNDKRIRFMKRMHKSLPMDSIRRIFSGIRSGVMSDDDEHDRGVFLSEMDHDQTATNKLKETDSAWVNSLKEHEQTDCKEYTRFKRKLELQKERPSELKKKLHGKELEIVRRNVKRLKLLMNKYNDDPVLVKKIRKKLSAIIGDLFWHSEYYGRGGLLGGHEGAHPEYIMNSFIYNPQKDEKRFKVLRIDGNKVTYQPYRNNEPVGEPIKLGLDEFLKTGISVEFGPRGNDPGFSLNIPIGEVYGIFPKRDYVDDTVESHNAKVDDYLEHLMRIFAKKPITEIFSTPVKSASGGRHKTHHKRDSKKNKRTCKRRT